MLKKKKEEEVVAEGSEFRFRHVDFQRTEEHRGKDVQQNTCGLY